MSRTKQSNAPSVAKKTGIVSAIEAGQTELWFHPEQEVGYFQGFQTLAYLNENNLLEGCAGLEDAEAIKTEGLPFFQKNFPAGRVAFWGDAQDGSVSYLFGRDDGVALRTVHIRSQFFQRSDPALRRK